MSSRNFLASLKSYYNVNLACPLLFGFRKTINFYCLGTMPIFSSRLYNNLDSSKWSLMAAYQMSQEKFQQHLSLVCKLQIC